MRPDVCSCLSELLPHILHPWSEQWPTDLSAADFCGEKVVERHMSRLGREPLYECITAASKTRDSKAMELVLMEYGEHWLPHHKPATWNIFEASARLRFH